MGLLLGGQVAGALLPRGRRLPVVVSLVLELRAWPRLCEYERREAEG